MSGNKETEHDVDLPITALSSLNQIQQFGDGKMKSLKYALFGATFVLVMNSAIQAQVTVDMSKFTCKQLLSGTPDAIEAAIWTSGYYNGLHKNTMLDLSVMKHNAELVVAACKNNSDKTLMQTVNALLAAGKKK